MHRPLTATAEATSNIALVKYWGKRDLALNLPRTGSISVTLDSLTTRTTVRFDDGLEADRIEFEGNHSARGTARIVRFLDLLRAQAETDLHAHVETQNNFPTAAGLASSASGFAALAVACDAALGLGLSDSELSILARRGSGSAARSIFGGYAEMRAGEEADGSDAYAVPIADPEHLPLTLLVAVTARGEKSIGSTEGMRRTETTSPFFEGWTRQVPKDLAAMRLAIRDADLEQVGVLAETNCLRMHAVALGAHPPLLYWNPTTVAAMQAVKELRGQGRGVWFTIDAGPQVKAICAPEDASHVARHLRAVPGVIEVLQAVPGPGARVVSEIPS
ncbi:MAG: diphosphomevalonate decarboxylase [Planctomycetota bacterium]|nr:diphosphomevalonate decarboxylase [Planctomycetota bacterium]